MRRRARAGQVGSGSQRRPAASPAAPQRGQFRTVLTLAGILLVAAGTQVIPTTPIHPIEISPVAAALPGVPFEIRIQENLRRVAEAVADADPDLADVYQEVSRAVLTAGRKLLHFDPDANRGRGSWAELVGTIDEATEVVGILVPGSSAFVVDANFDRYYQRARDLVEEADGRLAMVVWAAGTFPKGWVQAGLDRYPAELGRSLALFSQELRMELDREFGPVRRPRVVAVGHSFGGAVVGEAERYGLAVDAVLHVASAGVGRVRDPYDFPDPRRPRYSMTAPGDLIGLVQGLPTPPGLGHGPDPDDFRCVTTLPTGRLPDDPAARDELGRPLGERAGSAIGGVSSHSDVFIRYSDAWWGIYRFLVGTVPPPPECPPPDDEDPTRARLLPLAVPRVVTDSQCRAGGGLRPGGRHRPPAPRPA